MTELILRLTLDTNALGPFSIYTGSTSTTALYTGVTRNQLISGYAIELEGSSSGVTYTLIIENNQPGCDDNVVSKTIIVYATATPTPSNTPTPTQTPGITSSPTPTPTVTQTPDLSPSQTPSPTPTPSQTPSPGGTFYAYVIPEPLDATSQQELGQYLYDISGGGSDYYGYGNSGGYPAGSNYATDMNYYIQFSGWTGSNGNFVTNVSTFAGSIRQSSGAGTDSFGCLQNQYTFGSVEISTSDVETTIEYAYSIWVPLNGVGGTMSNMTVNVGNGTACSTDIGNDLIPDDINSSINVTVPSGCAIPAGIYRVLWIPNILGIPSALPLSSSIFIKGENKT